MSPLRKPTPLAVRPVFLKSPRRMEALVTLLQIASQAYRVLERRYRQTVLEDAPASEQRMPPKRYCASFVFTEASPRLRTCGA